MKVRYIIPFVLTLGGCSLSDVLPSFWDDNQSYKITDVYQKTVRFDCKQQHLPQISAIRDDLLWFQLYSESKGMLQQDVIKLVAPMQKTIEDFYKRSMEKEGSLAYCESKKKIMITQAKKAASGVMWRF